MPRAQDAQERRNAHSRRRTPAHGCAGLGIAKLALLRQGWLAQIYESMR